MNLIYACVFHQEQYIRLLKLLMTSISAKGNVNKETTHILIITSPQFQPIIEREIGFLSLSIHYFLLNLTTLFEAGCARLHLFEWNQIQNYDKILYLDTDILINSDVNVLFNTDIATDKLYAIEEGHIWHPFWGGDFFDFSCVDRDQTGFSSGVLYFHNSSEIRQLFLNILDHIHFYSTVENRQPPICLDQPFIVFHAMSQNKYDNQLMKSFMENNPVTVEPTKIIYHFPGGPGNYTSKYDKMTSFWNMMNGICRTFLTNKTYTWENDSITFLDNGKMNAFGEGVYRYINDHTINAFFGFREHTIEFNGDYTTYKSVRLGDDCTVTGKLIST